MGEKATASAPQIIAFPVKERVQADTLGLNVIEYGVHSNQVSLLRS